MCRCDPAFDRGPRARDWSSLIARQSRGTERAIKRDNPKGKSNRAFRRAMTLSLSRGVIAGPSRSRPPEPVKLPEGE
jgi:hypothetical protein